MKKEISKESSEIVVGLLDTLNKEQIKMDASLKETGDEDIGIASILGISIDQYNYSNPTVKLNDLEDLLEKHINAWLGYNMRDEQESKEYQKENERIAGITNAK